MEAFIEMFTVIGKHSPFLIIAGVFVFFWIMIEIDRYR